MKIQPTLSPLLLARLSSLTVDKLSWSLHRINLSTFILLTLIDNIAKEIFEKGRFIKIIRCPDIKLNNTKPKTRNISNPIIIWAKYKNEPSLTVNESNLN